MKKLIAIISMLFLLPLSAFGLTMMDDSQMNDVTAQAGVTIGIDMNMTMSVETAAWGDDGLDTDHDGLADTNGGWVGISDMDATLFVGLRNDIYDGTGPLTYADAEFLTIDVASGTAEYGGATFVRIGLGTLEVSGNMNFDFALGDGATLNTEGRMVLDETLGTVNMVGFEVLLGAGGTVDITADNRTGVTLGLDVLIDEINMTLGSWGDGDGIAHIWSGVTADGYVGLANLAIDDLEITGEVGIDVLTVTEAGLGAIVSGTAVGNAQEAVYKLANVVAAHAQLTPAEHPISPSMVMLTLGNADGTAEATDLMIEMATMESDIVVGTMGIDPSTGLATYDPSIINPATGLPVGVTGSMGSIYVGGVNVMIDGLVAIGAH